jgi:hypothetical protein
MAAMLCSIHEKIGQRDADEWDEIVRASSAGVFMSHGFVAQREHAPYIVIKEFPTEDRPTMDFLQEIGCRRFSSPAMNTFSRRFSDIDSSARTHTPIALWGRIARG